jgi:type II secretory pathway component PulC
MPYGFAAAAVAAAGSIYGSSKQQEAANTQADQERAAGYDAEYKGMLQERLNEMESEAVMKQANDQVAQIRRTSMQMRGSLTAAQAASGAVIGEGSAQAAMDQIEMLASADALAALYSGVNKVVQLKTNGRWAAEAGDKALQSSLGQANSLNSIGQTTMVTGITSAIGTLGSAYAKSGGLSGTSNLNTGGTAVNGSAGTPTMRNMA